MLFGTSPGSLMEGNTNEGVLFHVGGGLLVPSFMLSEEQPNKNIAETKARIRIFLFISTS